VQVVTLTKAEFNDLIRPLVERTLAAVMAEAHTVKGA